MEEISVIPMSIAAVGLTKLFSVSVSALGLTQLLVRTGLDLRSTSCPVGILALPQAHTDQSVIIITQICLRPGLRGPREAVQSS